MGGDHSSCLSSLYLHQRVPEDTPDSHDERTIEVSTPHLATEVQPREQSHVILERGRLLFPFVHTSRSESYSTPSACFDE